MYILEQAIEKQKDWFNLYLKENPYVDGQEAFDRLMNKNADLFPDIIDQLYLKLDEVERESFNCIADKALDEINNLSITDDIETDFGKLSDIKRTFFNILVNECIEVGVDRLIFIKDPTTGIIDLTPEFKMLH